MFDFAEVGGAVRDELMGLKSKDVDFTVVAKNPEAFPDALSAFNALVNELERKGFVVFVTTPEFLTVRARVPKDHALRHRTDVADFVLARRDGPSSDGRRPDWVVPGSLEDDLRRRDFTVNAMARVVQPDGSTQLVDLFNGVRDLNNRVLRFVGDPSTRIEEDGLRVMRMFRFSVTKRFEPDWETNYAARSEFAAQMLGKVSVERVREELLKMFAADTLLSLKLLEGLPQHTKEAVFRDGLSLMPTLKRL